jgi:sugar phosphate isomerase/epimerase
LYSVEAHPSPLHEVIRRAATAGYDGVEFANRFQEADPDTVAAALDDSGIEPVAAHAGVVTLEAALAGESDFLDRCTRVGCDRVIVPHVSPRHVRTRAAAQSLSSRLSSLARGLDAYDIELGYHTVGYDLRPFLPDAFGSLLHSVPVPDAVVARAAAASSQARPIDSTSIPTTTGLGSLMDSTRPDELFIEPDIGAVATAGFDPVTVCSALGSRARAVHICDVSPTGWLRRERSVPPGDGRIDLGAVVDATSEAGGEWVVYENELPTDPERKLTEGATLLDGLLK